MKILFTFTILLFTLTQERKFDSIEIDNIIVKNKLDRSYNFGSANELQKVFGKARIKKEKDEVLGGFAYSYTYKGFETYFNEKNWEATIITNADYRVLLNGITYKVGDPISKLKKQFPISYRDRAYSAVSIFMAHKKVVLDATVSFDYDSKGFITMILVANDNS
jgi:putative protein kinase ArgK-like GTPase of G3E family